MEGDGFKEHRGMRVAHAVLGRMRFNLDRERARQVPELTSKARSRPEVRAVRWSPTARSLTIEFDPSLAQHEVLNILVTAPSADDAKGGSVGAGWESIAQRAYELYLARGQSDGHDLDDWLAAERELEIKKTG